jgi:citronellol/citronellal dehydrogenase
MADLSGKTIVITGASRGIGRAMALKFARDGANIVVAAKSVKPHPKLAGTITETAAAVEQVGGRALAVQTDVRSEDQVQAMAAAAVEAFGGIDALVNNAGAISLTAVEDTPPKRYDLMQQINARAVFICSRAVLPYLKKSDNPHILSLCPPLSLAPRWLRDHAPYTLSKYGMTLLSMGMAEEFRRYRIAVNCLWPRTIIATAAIEFAVGNRSTLKYCRKPDIMADAAHAVLTSCARELTGQCLIDEGFLRDRGVTDFTPYANDPDFAGQPHLDLFIAD